MSSIEMIIDPASSATAVESQPDIAVASEQTDAAEADGQPLAPIPKYEVLERLDHDGVDYPVGARVILSEERAAALTRAGVVRLAE